MLYICKYLILLAAMVLFTGTTNVTVHAAYMGYTAAVKNEIQIMAIGPKTEFNLLLDKKIASASNGGKDYGIASDSNVEKESVFASSSNTEQ